MVLLRVDESADERDGLTLWPVYASAFGDYPDYDTWRKGVWDAHNNRSGFRLARAFDDGDLVGFAYGYQGEPGQWWTDNAGKVLDRQAASTWLGGHFEVVSIGVVPPARGSGVGRGLLRALTEGLPHERLLLMTTSDASDPARRLYSSEGWRVIGPGIGRDTVIMGKRATVGPPPARSSNESAAGNDR
jgi:ribosomal protein S18 acetylase RimI-like enzyme